MAVNSSRSMIADLHEGITDNSYIHLTPNRGNVENPPLERMTWNIYGQAEKHEDPPFIESHVRRAVLPKERRSSAQDSDLRF